MRSSQEYFYGHAGSQVSDRCPLGYLFFNILIMYGQNLTKFCIHIIIDKIYIGIVNRHFLQICNRVTALDWPQNSVFFQYLENGWTEFNQILYTHDHWQDVRWYCKSSFFRKFAIELRPLIDVRIQFLFNILRMNGQNLTKFCIHIIIDKICVGNVNPHFSQIATELRPLIDVII